MDKAPHLLLGGTLLLGLAASPLHAGDPQERLEIVDRAIAHHGGDVYRSSETELDLCSKSGCFDVRARIDGDLFEYDVSGGGRRVVYAWDRLELTEKGVPVPIKAGDEQRWRDWATARVYFCFLPYRLNDPGVWKRDLGLEEWDGKKLHKVKVTFTPGSSTDADDEYLYWFDPETGRVEQFAYSFEGRPGGLRFRRAHDYRRVGGILFFDQENLGAAGDGLSVDLVTPDYVAKKMKKVSDVRLEEVVVRPLE